MSIILPILTEYNDKGVKSAQTSLAGLSKSYFSTAAAATTIAAVLKKTINSASDLSETINKSNVIFGASANSIREFANTASTTFGQSKQQALEAASTFAMFGKSAGLAGEDLVTFSTDFVTLASDLASFNNTSPQDAIEAIGAALRGEAEPIRRYNVLLSDAVLKNRALEMKIYDGNGALTSQQKIMATQAEIFDQANDAIGDYERTSDGFANTTKSLTAQMEDLSAAIGGQLLPVAEDLAVITSGIASTTKTADGNTSGFGKTIGALAVQIVPGIKELRDFAIIADFFSDKIKEAGRATLDSAADFRKFDQQMTAKYNKTVKDSTRLTDSLTGSQKKGQTAAEKLREKNKKLSDSLKTDLKDALKDAKDRVEDLKEESNSLADSLRDQITGFVSLSDAVDTSQTAEEKYNDALKDRADAYAVLNKLEAERQRRGFGPNDQVTYDAEEYADALKDVADAEADVLSAQSKRINYSEKFANDIAAASQFAGKLKILTERGLGQAGIQQLLNVGPVAGNQIATDLINGTGPLTFEGFKSSLAGLAADGQALGDVTATGVFGTAIAGAQAEVDALGNARVGTVNNNVIIQVSGTDPQAVVDALKKWMKVNGSIPIRVKG
jgi:predicted nuclease with TOPRIM domain